MGPTERRYEIMKILCRRRCETIRHLASEFGVSMRTIQRDIEALSGTQPIYTRFGKYGGGVYVVEGYSMDRMYMTTAELDVLQKLYLAANEDVQLLTVAEKNRLRLLISQYSKPKNKSKKGS
ncbi:MAG: HTH domain-containing protein [Clostridia bacterium]|nr:HTH domain-containing protein [Clostridia bacterium]